MLAELFSRSFDLIDLESPSMMGGAISGHEREEIKAELEGRKRSDMDAMCGLFGTKFCRMQCTQLDIVQTSEGDKKAEMVVNLALQCLTNAKGECTSSSVKFSQCNLLNISYCPVIENENADEKNLV